MSGRAGFRPTWFVSRAHALTIYTRVRPLRPFRAVRLRSTASTGTREKERGKIRGGTVFPLGRKYTQRSSQEAKTECDQQGQESLRIVSRRIKLNKPLFG